MTSPPAYEVPTWRMLEALAKLEALGEAGAPRGYAFGGRINAGLLRRGFAELRGDRWYLTDLGREALEIQRRGKRSWSQSLGRWVPA